MGPQAAGRGSDAGAIHRTCSGVFAPGITDVACRVRDAKPQTHLRLVLIRIALKQRLHRFQLPQILVQFFRREIKTPVSSLMNWIAA
jgi:hypothetical protein